MDVNVIKEILVSVVPAFSASSTIIGCMLFLLRKIKHQAQESDKRLLESQTRLKKAYDDIAKIKAKTESMEKYLMEIKEKK